jgi:hypothetical protein
LLMIVSMMLSQSDRRPSMRSNAAIA